MFTFYIENHEPFGSLTKNCPKLDKNKSIVARFSVFVVYKPEVSTVQKSNSILQKKSEIVGEIFLQVWKSVFDDFLQITGNKCI